LQQETKELGRLIAVHPIAPIYVQRAVFIALLSFLFFMGMMLTFYLRQSLMYFLLATAFLLVYLVMMVSWYTQRRSVVHLYEGGFGFKSNVLRWDEIESINDDKQVVISTKDGKRIELPATISEPAAMVRHIRFRIANSGK
jgi:uncharacterized membrane protein